MDSSRAHLKQLAEAQIAELEALLSEREAAQAHLRDLAMTEALIDLSADGARLQRYEAHHQRTLREALKQLHTCQKLRRQNSDNDCDNADDYIYDDCNDKEGGTDGVCATSESEYPPLVAETPPVPPDAATINESATGESSLDTGITEGATGGVFATSESNDLALVETPPVPPNTTPPQPLQQESFARELASLRAERHDRLASLRAERLDKVASLRARIAADRARLTRDDLDRLTRPAPVAPFRASAPTA